MIAYRTIPVDGTEVFYGEGGDGTARTLLLLLHGVGFALDVDYAPTDAFRVAQLTPPDSSCSVQLGKGLTDARAGSVRNTYVLVTDLEATRAGLLERGVEVSEIRHKTPVDAWAGSFARRLDAERRDYASFAHFADPDGSTCVLQERGFRERSGDDATRVGKVGEEPDDDPKQGRQVTENPFQDPTGRHHRAAAR
jgi:hypothetical protein